MVELNTQPGAMTMKSLRKFSHGFDMVIVAHRKLGKGGCPAHIVDAADSGDDHTNPTFSALFIVVH